MDLLDQGVARLAIDIRNTAGGSFEEGIAAARLFVGTGTLLRRVEKDNAEVIIKATAGGNAIDIPLVLMTNRGTAHAAELFAASLSGSNRAITIGQRSAGLVSLQKLVKLPDGTGLWMSWARYQYGSGNPIHQFGVEPAVEVELPFVELGELKPAGDPTLEKAIEHLRTIIL